LFPSDLFTGFGPSRIHPQGFEPLLAQATGRKTHQLRAGVRSDTPRLPGVYGMIDRRGCLIYVGKSKSLRCRLLSYFRVKSRDRKAGRIIGRAHSIIWETAPDEFAALIRELELIRRFRPRYNVMGQPGRHRYMFIGLGRAPAPYLFATREPTGNEIALYGPFVGARTAASAVRRLNDIYRLRDCSQKQAMHFSDQRSLFALDLVPGCLRHEIGTCLGPCAGSCSQRDYSKNVRAARAFLDGDTQGLLDTLQQEMLEASRTLQFERAMLVRDRLAEIRWLSDRLVWLKNARAEHSFVYPLKGADGRVLWYLIERGQVRGVVYPPKTVRAARNVAKQIAEIYAVKANLETVMPRGQVDSVLLVAAWFRKRPEERTRCLTSDAVAAQLPSI